MQLNNKQRQAIIAICIHCPYKECKSASQNGCKYYKKQFAKILKNEITIGEFYEIVKKVLTGAKFMPFVDLKVVDDIIKAIKNEVKKNE